MSDNIEWEKINGVSGSGILVEGHSINTDLIIPARYLKCLTWETLGNYAFQDKRYDVQTGEQLDHTFNEPQYEGASILFVNADFGSGSSREHAPQALKHWGIQAIVAESYAGIFEGNCRRVGMPAVTISKEDQQKIIRLVQNNPGEQFAINLDQKLLLYDGQEIPIDISEPTRIALTEGYWDATKMLMQNLDQVKSFEATRPKVVDYKTLEQKV